MDARLYRAALVAASLLSLGAGYRTQNFLVTAPTPQFAQQVAKSAEDFRRDLAVEWLGQELPPWTEPCPITVHVGPQMGAGGATSFAFIGGRPTGWTMTIQGSAERIIDSVLPHEITHTVFATHFGRPLPRWADEGACTTVEHDSEKQKQHRLLYQFLTSGRGIPFNQMFAMTEYPPDVLPLYSQGFSLARFLIAQGGKQKFVQYVGDGMRWNNWTKATEKHYAFRSLSELQVTWLDWVRQGCPAIESRGTQIAAQEDSTPGKLVSIEGAAEQRSNVISLASRTTPTQLAAAGTSWYARVRDQTVANRGNGTSQYDSASAFHNAAQQAVTKGTRPSAPQVVTRPQPLERAEQRVIE